jgi:hypothetical protein
MSKIIPFPVSEEAKRRLAARDGRLAGLKKTEAALARPGHILLAWAKMGRGDCIRAWYVPCEGKRWVYAWDYDGAAMLDFGGRSRHSSSAVYDWLTDSGSKGLFSEFHVCAPPYILLDSAELRQKYQAGELAAYYA